MKRKLYYTVEKNVSTDGETLDGNKTVTVYDIVDNSPKLFFMLDLVLSDNTQDEIQDYLDDNGYGDEDFKFIQL